jgi:GT2 family glycosyltransferase
MSRVAANVLNYNLGRYLPACLDSLRRQTLPARLTLIDNASPEGLPEGLRGVDLRVIQTGRNLGYSGGHNRGIREAAEPFILVLNPDLILEPGCVEALVAALDATPRAAMAGGKLLRMNPDGGLPNPVAPARGSAKGSGPAGGETGDVGSIPRSHLYIGGWDLGIRGTGASVPVIDSTGVRLTRARKSYDRGADEPDSGQWDAAGPPFGPSGALALFRREMLEDIASDGEYFDEDFFMYREEVDLAWRARLRGWECAYAPEAVAYHARGYAPGTRARQPERHRLLQFRNRLLMIVKNDQPADVLRHLPWLAVYELLALGHSLLRERFLLAGYVEALRLLPRFLAKRRRIQARRNVDAAAIRPWLGA